MVESWERVVEEVNTTSDRLGAVASKVVQVQNRLISTNWEPLNDRKDLADQLLTTAKDLYGFARSQLQVLTDLRITVQRVLASKPIISVNQSLTLHDTDYGNEIRLPLACTQALLPLLTTQPAKSGSQSKNEEKIDDSTDDENIPVWYTDPDIISGNYGTPQRRYPNYRDDDWDHYDDYPQDYQDNARQAIINATIPGPEVTQNESMSSSDSRSNRHSGAPSSISKDSESTSTGFTQVTTDSSDTLNQVTLSPEVLDNHTTSPAFFSIQNYQSKEDNTIENSSVDSNAATQNLIANMSMSSLDQSSHIDSNSLEQHHGSYETGSSKETNSTSLDLNTPAS